jgi:hypothetical protein
MDYTQAQDYSTDLSTGHRYHDVDKATPTVWSDKDANSVIWSLMEVVIAAGGTPRQFNKADPATYQVLKAALDTLYGPVATVGTVTLALGTSALPNTLKLNGAVLVRSAYPALWTYAQASGNLVGDGAWFGGRRGSYSTGDGVSTFRLPDVRGIFPRFFHDGSALDPDYLTRVMGALQLSDNLAHSHLQRLNGPDYDQSGDGGDQNSGTKYADYVRNANIDTASSGGSESRPINYPFLALVRYK